MRNLSLSSRSRSIQQKVNASQEAKRSVGYNRKFLYDYQPNSTFYLPETTRQHLREIGATGVDDTPGTFAKRVYEKLLIDLSWNSSRLEGNTYSIFDTKRLLSFHSKAEGKHQDET